MALSGRAMKHTACSKSRYRPADASNSHDDTNVRALAEIATEVAFGGKYRRSTELLQSTNLPSIIQSN